MQDADRLTIEQMSEFLQGSRAIEFSLRERLAVYGFLERVLAHQHYGRLPKLQRGVVRAYLSSARMTPFPTPFPRARVQTVAPPSFSPALPTSTRLAI
jgi:hypothetical protein